MPADVPPRARRSGRRRAAMAVLALGAVLTACAPLGSAPADPTAHGAPSPGATTSVGTSPAPPAPGATMLVPAGSAAENLPLFAAVTADVWASGDRAAGRAYVDALVAAGFDKSAMQVTNDRTTVGNPAESVQFSVRWGDDCLVGQIGPATGDPVTVVLPALAEGTCLVGATRPIDW